MLKLFKLGSKVTKLSSRIQTRKPSNKAVIRKPHAYGETFVAQAKSVKARDGHRCKRCGWQPPKKFRWLLHAHHKTSKQQGGRDTMSNLVSLCVQCHVAEHPKNTWFSDNTLNMVALVKKLKRGQGFKCYG